MKFTAIFIDVTHVDSPVTGTQEIDADNRDEAYSKANALANYNEVVGDVVPCAEFVATERL